MVVNCVRLLLNRRFNSLCPLSFFLNCFILIPSSYNSNMNNIGPANPHYQQTNNLTTTHLSPRFFKLLNPNVTFSSHKAWSQNVIHATPISQQKQANHQYPFKAFYLSENRFHPSNQQCKLVWEKALAMTFIQTFYAILIQKTQQDPQPIMACVKPVATVSPFN